MTALIAYFVFIAGCGLLGAWLVVTELLHTRRGDLPEDDWLPDEEQYDRVPEVR